MGLLEGQLTVMDLMVDLILDYPFGFPFAPNRPAAAAADSARAGLRLGRDCMDIIRS
jgi:hypothetical protein